MLGSTERREVRLIAMKLFSKNSNLCDHDSSTSQTCRRTDGQLAIAIPRSSYPMHYMYVGLLERIQARKTTTTGTEGPFTRSLYNTTIPVSGSVQDHRLLILPYFLG